MLVCFDLPVTTPISKRRYARFRKGLLREGFQMLQYSVYARPCPSLDKMDTEVRRLVKMIPEVGEVRALLFTDAQWGRMLVYRNREEKPPEKQPDQLLLF